MSEVLDIGEISLVPKINGKEIYGITPIIDLPNIKSPTINDPFISNQYIPTVENRKQDEMSRVENIPASDFHSDRSSTSGPLINNTSTNLNKPFIQPIVLNESIRSQRTETLKSPVQKVKNDKPVINELSPDDLINERIKLSTELFELSKKYPQLGIPDPKSFKEVSSMVKCRDLVQDNISNTGNITQVKTYMFIGLVAVEVVFCRYIKIDVNGFAETQIKNINRWEPLINKISERNYIKSYEENFPVEYRLGIMMTIQLGLLWFLNTMYKFESKKERNEYIENINTFVGSLGESTTDSVLDGIAKLSPLLTNLGKTETRREKAQKNNTSSETKPSINNKSDRPVKNTRRSKRTLPTT